MLKRLCFLSTVFITLLCTEVRAEVGVSAFAMLSNKFPCEQYLKLFKGSPVAFTSILLGTFGNNQRCLRKFMRLKQRKIIQLHVSNEAGRRNNRLTVGELTPKLTISQYGKAWKEFSPTVIVSLLNRVEPFASLANENPHIEWIMSDGLESNDDVAAARNRINTIKSMWKYKIAYAPLDFVRSWRATGADYIEQHGVTPKLTYPCIANLDGADIDFGDGRGKATRGLKASEVPAYIKKYKKRGCKVLLWWSSLQGTRKGWKPPRDRTFTIYKEQSVLVNKWIRRYNNER